METRKLIITLNKNPDDDLMILEEVMRLVKEGFCCGVDPQWDTVTE
tara:strand:+ start:436 stop:573 length:138 start_codon:yes stop_codon:yes gene_type:complete